MDKGLECDLWMDGQLLMPNYLALEYRLLSWNLLLAELRAEFSAPHALSQNDEDETILSIKTQPKRFFYL